MNYFMVYYIFILFIREMQFLTYCVNQSLDSIKQKKSATCISDIAQTLKNRMEQSSQMF